MDREEKRQVRLRIVRLLDTECKGCKHLISHGETPTYCNTVCAAGIEMQSLSASLMLDEKNKLKKEPVVEAEPVKRGPWSSDEEFYLTNHIRVSNPKHLAKKLNRSLTSTVAKINALKRKAVKQCFTR
jgi:hypothetical protein